MELPIPTGGSAYRHTRYHFESPAYPPAHVCTRYLRAVHLARELDLDELYVHGNDIDLIVRRRTTRGALRQEIATVLFAKGVVLLTLLKRTVPDWVGWIQRNPIPPVLTAEGFLRLLELAESLAQELGGSFLDIARSGYCYARDPEAYSVMLVPVMWPRLPIPFSTAGAGDTSSAVVAVYSGK